MLFNILRRRILILGIMVPTIAMFALGSCANPTGTPLSTYSDVTSTSEQFAHDLIGDWRLIAAESDDFSTNEQGLITISFTGAELSGVESCAPYSGRYRLDGNALILSDIETTAEDCGDWTGSGSFIRFPRENLTVGFDGDILILANTSWRYEFERDTPS